jgi:predicted MFS family arabinose efflux permease
VTIGRIPRAKLQSARSLGRKLTFGAFELFRPQPLRAVIVSWGVAQLAWMLVNVTELIVARTVFHVGSLGFGLLAGAMGAGLLAGSLLAGPLASRAPLGVLYRNALLLAATGYLVGALLHSFALALVAAAVATTGNALAVGFADLTIQKLAPADRLGEAFGVFQSVTSTCGVVAMAGAGVLADAVGGRAAWVVAAAVLVAAATLAASLQRVRVPRPVPATR